MKILKPLNALIILFSIGGACAFSWLLYKDVYLNRVSIDGLEEAGVVFETQATVKRKFGDAMVWDPLVHKDKLFWNDAIQTSEKSKVILTLSDGNKIILGESSLVVLERNNNQLSLHLKSGELVVAAAEPVKGKSKPSTQIVVNGVELKKDSEGNIALQFDESKRELVATTTTEEGEGKQIVVDREGKVEERKLPVLLQAPMTLSHFYSDSRKTDVKFKWTSTEKKFDFIVAEDKEFTKPVIRKSLSRPEFEDSLPAGQYYWKVIAADGVSSEVRSFEVTRAFDPELKGPANKKSFVFKSELPIVEFSWESESQPTKFVVQMSKGEDFKEIYFEQETLQTTMRSSQLAEGTLFWRVVSHFGSLTKTSDVQKIILTRNLETQPPKLVAPMTDFKVGLDFFRKSGGIPFKWETGDQETRRFVLSKDKGLKEEVVAFETTQNEALISDSLEMGTYYWSVAHKNFDGKWVYSETRKIEIGPLVDVLPAPALLQPLANAEVDLIENPQIKWKWKEVPGAQKYRFTLLSLGDKKVVLEDITRSLEKEKSDLADGVYKWSVVAIDKFGRESEVSEYEMKVIHGQILEAPEFEVEEVQ